MKSRDYLNRKIEEILLRFPNIKISYLYDESLETHLIEVLPADIYNFNESYKLFESDISFEFDEKYFPETLLFISKDSLSRIKDPEFELEGAYYNIKPEVKTAPKFNFVLVDKVLVNDTEYNLLALAA